MKAFESEFESEFEFEFATRVFAPVWILFLFWIVLGVPGFLWFLWFLWS